jgi:hypothetical protein
MFHSVRFVLQDARGKGIVTELMNTVHFMSFHVCVSSSDSKVPKDRN